MTTHDRSVLGVCLQAWTKRCCRCVLLTLALYLVTGCMQNIAAEHGVEGLQKYLAESGSGAQVMTPGQLKERQAQLKKMKADMEAGREL